MVCTFFGHRDTPKEKEPALRKTLIDLIENNNLDTFYVGNNGNFDTMVRSILFELEKIYPIKIFIVLAYFPKAELEYGNYTIVPDGIEKIPPKFAIDYRNRWMVNRADYVVTAVTRSFGGAAKFSEYSKRQNKTVIEL